jgi:hypothetical protein
VSVTEKREQQRSPRASSGSAWLGPALLAAAFVALIAWSWRRWPDVLVDFGRELYVPWQLTSGKALYVDIAYFNGPLSPWFNSALFQLFGDSVLTLVMANLAILVAIGAIIYFLLLEVSRPLTATVGTLVFLTVFAFGQYMPQGNYNFVTPYSHEMTHGTLLSLAALVFLLTHLRRQGVWSAFGCGLAVGLTFLTKGEFFLSVTIAVLTGLALHHRFRRTPIPDGLRVGAVFTAGLLLPPIAAFLLLLPNRSPEEAFTGVLGSWAYVLVRGLSESKFYRDVVGITDVGESLGIIGAWSFRYAAILVPATLISLYLPRFKRLSALPTGLLAPIAAVAVLARWRTTEWEYIARPFPVVLLVCAGLVLVLQTRPVTDPEQRIRRVLAVSLVLYALTLLTKMFLNVRFIHYGFALAMPAAIVVVVLLLESIPEALNRRGGSGAAFRAASIGILVGVMGMHLYASNSWFRLRTIEIGKGSDSFLTDDRGRVAAEILERLEQLRSPGETLAVLPEGVMLNYLSRMANPTPYINFMPPEMIMFGEERIIDAFRADPPDWIVITDRSLPEYGYRAIGDDYGLRIVTWIEGNYTLAERVTEEDSKREQLRFALILRRRVELAPTPASDTPVPLPITGSTSPPVRPKDQPRRDPEAGDRERDPREVRVRPSRVADRWLRPFAPDESRSPANCWRRWRSMGPGDERSRTSELRPRDAAG